MAKIIIDITAREPHFKTTRLIDAEVKLQVLTNDSLTTELLAEALQDILANKFLPTAIKQVMDRITALPTVAADALAEEPAHAAQEVTDVRH